ncbi:hypothetical protein I4U23_007326 [Adineta vaga]|nr:hypothetical protein I4U23_007326 [Adineta vaga]
MSNEFFCKICDIQCNGSGPFQQHLGSARHIKKARLITSETSSSSSSDKTSSNNANVSVSSITNTNIPFASTATNITQDTDISSGLFSISPETMRILLEWDHPNGYKPYCDICQLPLYAPKNADVHFARDNNMHWQKLAALEQIRRGEPDYSCKICSEIFSTDTQMSAHLYSDAHATVRQQKATLEKIIKIYETYNQLKEARKKRKDIETSSIVEDDLSNQFQSLKVIDGTATTSKSEKEFFNLIALTNVMKKKFDDDDF